MPPCFLTKHEGRFRTTHHELGLEQGQELLDLRRLSPNSSSMASHDTSLLTTCAHEIHPPTFFATLTLTYASNLTFQKLYFRGSHEKTNGRHPPLSLAEPAPLALSRTPLRNSL